MSEVAESGTAHLMAVESPGKRFLRATEIALRSSGATSYARTSYTMPSESSSRAALVLMGFAILIAAYNPTECAGGVSVEETIEPARIVSVLSTSDSARCA